MRRALAVLAACLTAGGGGCGRIRCGDDSDCSGGYCQAGYCAPPATAGADGCRRDHECRSNQTCVPDTGACRARRGTAPPGTPCANDDDCDRGSCQLGLCVQLCADAGDCQSGAVCEDMIGLTSDQDSFDMRGCVPESGVTHFGTTDSMPLPANAQSFTIFLQAPTYDLGNRLFVDHLMSPTGDQIFPDPALPSSGSYDPFGQLIRFIPTDTSAAMLAPNAPNVVVNSGLYTFGMGSTNGSPVAAQVWLKLGSAPPTSGHAVLNVYVTELLGSPCAPFTATDAPTALADTIEQLRAILAQPTVAITIDDVHFIDVAAESFVRIPDDSGMQPLPDLDQMLMRATMPASPGAEAALEVVLVHAITDQYNGVTNTIGMAGGIPTSPIRGTPHSGVIVSSDALCGGAALLSSVMAHELGHSLGLWHSIEKNGLHDALGDTATDGTDENVMNWQENGGRHFSAAQGAVMRLDPKVKP